MNPQADFYFEKESPWQSCFQKLRKIILSCGPDEEIKWGHPCYVLGKKNIVLMHGFKEYCALLFFNGALLSDPEKILVQQTANVQAARQIRFTTVKEITKWQAAIKAYIYETIELEKAGIKVKLKKTEDFPVPEEFKKKLARNTALKKAFQALTPGRQRAYLFYFSQAKQAATREARVEKCVPAILAGKGLDD